MKLSILLEDAPRRKPSSELSSERAAALLARRVRANSNSAKTWALGTYRVMSYNYTTAMNRIPDLRTAPRDTLQKYLNTYQGGAALSRKFYANPADFYIEDADEVTSDADPQSIIPDGYPYIWIGDKEVLKQHGLDEDDFRDHVEDAVQKARAEKRRAKADARYKRAIKKYNEEQAALMHKAATAAASTSAPPPPVSRTLTLSQYNKNLLNPYLMGKTDTQYNGPLAGCKFIKNSVSVMMNVFALALARIGDPIVNIQYSNDGTVDMFYASTASNNIHFYVRGTLTSQMLLAVNGRGWRLQHVYKNNDVEKTKDMLEVLMRK